MEQALKKLCEDVEKAVSNGLEIVVLSDRISKEEMDISRPPIPTLLAVGSVHHHLIRYNSSCRYPCRILVCSCTCAFHFGRVSYFIHS